jgi:succinate dehydrogenase hydrophobic anchor subunit
MDRFLSVKGFLFWGGVVLIIVGILSYLPFTNASGSIFGAFWWFDGTEGVVHIALGVVAIAASYILSGDLARWLVIAVGVVALLFAIYGLILPQGPIGSANIDGANLESPMDSILHLFVAVWALYAAFVGRPAMASGRM